ncbi:MAG: winged helix-turn-helix transcriptional regulator [Acidobacteria bacterium]|nr:winged helix-turn-helix transcriptional regulator [Acidobacteriota bacterium]
MHAFDVLADPVRRRALELIAQHEQASGDIVTVIQAEFGITQSAVSQHLRVLRESGFAVVRKDGAKRCYSLDLKGFRDVESWLNQIQHFWDTRLEALATEVARGKRKRKGE